MDKILAFFLVICCHHAAANILDLESSVGMRQACPDEMVTFTCTCSGSSGSWHVNPRLPDDAETGSPVDMTITLNFTSTAQLNGTVVECRCSGGNGTDSLNDTLSVTGLPSPPGNPSYTVQQYGRDNVTLTVQWQPPLYHGGGEVNYAITGIPGLNPVTTSRTNVTVTVPYNVRHTVSIVATNCNGSSNAAMGTIRIANCSDPDVPGNGSIEAYQNTTQGAEISFSCNSGFVPAMNMMATCAENGSWTPNPAALNCTESEPSGTRIHLPSWAVVLTAIVALFLTKEE